MTSIGGHQPAGLQAILHLSQKLAAGQTVQARVLGQTRHGVSVSIGREVFQLNVSSSLTNVETLTLQGTRSPSPSGQQVKIIASDDRPLAKPIEAHLAAGTRTSQPDASTIVQKSEINVIANPVSPEGKVLGPGVTLQLQTSAPEAAVKLTGEKLSIMSGDKPVVESNLPHKAPAVPVRPLGSIVPPASRSATNVAHAHGSDERVGKPELTGKLPQKALPTLTSPLPASTAVGHLLATVKNSGYGAQLPGDQSRQLQPTAASPLSSDIEPISTKNVTTPIAIKSATAPPAVNRGQGVVTEARGLAPTPPRVEPQTADRRGTVTASVVGRTSTGNVVLEAAGQLLRIEQPVDLPPGTTLQVTFASGMPAGMTPTDRRVADSPATLLNRLIDLLDDIDQVGRQTEEPGHSSSTKQLPMADRHLASRFLGLLSPEAGGQSLAKVMSSSPEPEGIATPKGDQIQTLVRELGSMASESLADGWKSMTLPLGSDQSQAVSLYFRDHDLDPDDEASDEEAEQKKAQRAIFDVSFSQLGRCQIDALCQEHRFDLLVRSEKPFGPKDRQDVATLFVSALEIAGMKGEIGFHVSSFFEPVRSVSLGRELKT